MPIKQTILLFISCFSFLNASAQCGTPITNLPYREGFESTNGSWVSGGSGNNWAWGTPNKAVIRSAGEANRCWVTGGLTGIGYAASEASWLRSPCFDLSAIQNPYVEFMIFWDTEQQFDGASLQYSLDQGASWITAGTASGPKNCLNENWYNQGTVTYLSNLTTVRDGWSGTAQSTSGSCRGGNGSGGWVRAKQTLPVLAGKPSVQFRFIFGAGTICNNFDGLAIDDFYVGEAPPNQADFDIVCVTGDTVDFTDRSLPCPQQYNWDFGDPASGTNNTSTIKNPRHVFSAPGTYTIKLTTAGPNNAPSTQTKNITILRANAVQKKPADCVTDQGGQAEVFVQGSGGPFLYNWNTIPAQVTSVASDLSSGIYLVRVSATGACPVTDTVLIVVDNNCGAIRFPSGFTPNRDGKNDGFGVLGGLGSIQEYRLTIYNRWGQEIFTTTDPSKKWDGLVRGITADPGAYVWMAEITLRNQPLRREKGTFVLIR
ncbi:MAG: hypothetical protein RL750_609 [Bacteroidota bacterium]